MLRRRNGCSGLGHSDKAVWELRYLRRFGYDKKYFSFEAGRRCTDGPGIWAVSTPKAKELFSMVDFYVNKNPYKGVGTAGSGEPKKLAYAQLDLSSKAAFKIAKGNGAGKGKATTSYAELDFEQMDAMADGNQGVAL
ncbi:uncharacterized protein MONBRDRAFT_6126 [Monosiga brevicollis MX1]|uniref:IRS-type PTB domain-containing protein n=1 Tax=Monosiga brevicollis TaxID=81824 RepID=A9USW5_MONBE|nr:uncharacterized protein MONBRDRAFT_6126 [Monosiga brevicollis MX1]EDQ91394.1 predicted protein [Monosiga brevicollis MX1]|eukprot:XP_001743816.1 hypothetical protein [Monosiga brevicollis MX1]